MVLLPISGKGHSLPDKSALYEAHTLVDAMKRAEQLKLAQTPAFKRLLHYDGTESLVDKDSPFFLACDGFKNPQAELSATLQAFYDKMPLDDRHAICRFPARFSYLTEQLNLPRSDFPMPDCARYKEFRQKVPAQSVSLVFAGESNLSPSSMMGHLFLKFSGFENREIHAVQKEHQNDVPDKQFNGVTNTESYAQLCGEQTDSHKGRPTEYALSFFASFSEQSTAAFYVKALAGNVDGFYILSPYRKKVSEYVFTEERPLWEFEMALNDKQKEQLMNHIWELKEKKVKYAFISNNCGKASVDLLQVANPQWGASQKPFQTPLGHIQNLSGQGAVQNITLVPSDAYALKMKQNPKNPLKAAGTSRVSVYWRHLNGSFVGASFMPVYRDIIDPEPAYHDALETKIMTINAAYRPADGNFFIDGIDVMKLKSIINASQSFAFSKDFKFSLENDLGDDTTRLRPTAEGGLGVGYEILNGVTPYILPKIGYRYNKFHNFYLTPEIGVIVNATEQLRLTASFAPYLNTKAQNRGYDSKFGASAAYRFYENYTFFTHFNAYGDTDIRRKRELITGVAVSF